MKQKYSKNEENQTMNSALKIVQKFFPGVKKVWDGIKPVDVQINQKDVNSGEVKNHTSCVMAVACKRMFDADGIIIARSTAYIVKNGAAVRFRVPAQLAKETAKFDRKKGFKTGIYQLLVPKPSWKLGARAKRKASVGPFPGTNAKRPYKKATPSMEIRTSLRNVK